MNKIRFVDHKIDNFKHRFVRFLAVVGSVEVEAIEFRKSIGHVRGFSNAVQKSRPWVTLSFWSKL